jgi:hypothetical protein
VPEHEQFGIFRPVAAEHQDGQAEYPAREKVDDLEQHPQANQHHVTTAGESAGQPLNRVFERHRFRQSLYECLDARADALFELADAVLACHDYSEDCCCPGVRQALDELFPEGGELTNSLFVVRR